MTESGSVTTVCPLLIRWAEGELPRDREKYEDSKFVGGGAQIELIFPCDSLDGNTSRQYWQRGGLVPLMFVATQRVFITLS